MESIIIAGVTVTASAPVLAQYRAEVAEDKAEQEAYAYLRSLRAQVEAGDEEAASLYSDAFKDLHGIRPRW